MTPNIIYSVCATCLFLHFIIWTITDPRSFKKKWQESFNKKRISLYVKSVIFLSLYLGLSLYFSWPSGRNDNSWESFGLILFILGEFFAIWARLTMNKNWGIPALHDKSRQSRLVTNGPFNFTRNPIYIGLLCMFIGFSLALRSYSVLLCFVVFYQIYVTILEEEILLKKHFGEQYKSYMQKVPRFI